ncbi:hypothetical protein ASG43_06040 [Aureimonas sp. Leaf454]|uniref:hypothetical protein n=1 Tax=Aureimonas sp. Leaf454 TaxID=1736381 RepID=UPI0006F7DDAA|nr:hypothetical protein [Aureimonas sp. Leaf454]KQT50822.1 hypothetical protein ASG43_06040 [Aureimonas sp. Leaf454]
MLHCPPRPNNAEEDAAWQGRPRSWAGSPAPKVVPWLAAVALALAGAVALGMLVDRYEPTRSFFIEDGPVEVLQAALLLGIAGIFAAAFLRSAGSRALFCLVAAYVCIFALTREIPRCGSAFSGDGACLTSGWKETIVASASVLGVLALVLRPIDWFDASRLSNIRWIWPSLPIVGLLVAAEALESLIYYSEIEEFFELIAYLYLGVFAFSILRGTVERRPST